MRWLVALLLIPLVAATEPAPAPAEELDFTIGGEADWRITWNITDAEVNVGLPGYTNPSDATHAPVEVFIGIGHEGDAEPTEWYVLHHGNASWSVSHTGVTEETPRNGLGTPYWTIQRVDGIEGDCVVAAAETWQRVDGERAVLERVPGVPLTDAWGDGHNCHVQDGEQAGAPEPVKKSPSPVWLAAIALFAAIALRRR